MHAQRKFAQGSVPCPVGGGGDDDNIHHQHPPSCGGVRRERSTSLDGRPKQHRHITSTGGGVDGCTRVVGGGAATPTFTGGPYDAFLR